MKLPDNFDWKYWITAFDMMQERYVFQRNERFNIIANLITATNNDNGMIVDLGCGTGTLSEFIINQMPNVKLIGIDYDPSLIALATQRFSKLQDRIELFQLDIRNSKWLNEINSSDISAIVSSTALHWLSAQELSDLYKQLFSLLRPDGIFLNSDHAGTEKPQLQNWCEKVLDSELKDNTPDHSLSWDEFWTNYATALKIDLPTLQKEFTGNWNGIEAGLPLSWHLAKLQDSGFPYTDCFWKYYGEAIYGAIR